MGPRSKIILSVWGFALSTLFGIWMWVMLAMKPPDVIAQTLLWLNTRWVQWTLLAFFCFCAVLSIAIWFVEPVLANFIGRKSTPPPPKPPAPGKSSSPATTPPANPSRMEGDRIIVGVTPDFLMDQFIGRTSLHTKSIIAPFIGKWMRVSGHLADTVEDAQDRWIQASFRLPGDKIRSVIMYFDPAWRSRLEVLFKEDHIVVLGQISKIESTIIVMENCEIVER